MSLIAFFSFFYLKRILILLIILSSDCFCIFNLISFFPCSHTICLPYSLSVFAIKRVITLYLKQPRFSYGLKDKINQTFVPSAFNRSFVLHFFPLKFIHIIYGHNNWFKKQFFFFFCFFVLVLVLYVLIFHLLIL